MMLASIAPTATLGATYSDELEGAYDYAYGIGITTQSSIDTANMYGTLIRSHMAKMMVNYAKEVLGRTADTSLECNFTDIANQSEELRGYIVEACQMGLMGQGITAFNPNGIVTRAQFGTVLSRALWGDQYNGADPYYADHLAALQDAGIMNNISTPNAPEVRGYVMLMMQRAAGDTTPAICDTPENALSCSLGLDTCPVECRTNEVKEGTLNVSLGDSLADGTQIPSTGIVRFATVNFKASSSDVSLKTVSLQKVGLANVPSGTKVWFEKNGVRISGRTSFTSEGDAYLSFAPIYVVKAGATESIDLYVELATSAGSDVQFKSMDITSTAQDVNGSFTTPALRTAEYTVSEVKFTADTAWGSAKSTDNGVILWEFTLSDINPSRDVSFKSIVLRQQGTASLDNLSDLVIERNGSVVSDSYTIDGKYLTMKLNDTIKKETSSVKYILKGIVNNVETASESYDFKVNNTTDFNAIETLNGFRVSLTGTYDMGTYTINGGDLTFARDTSLELTKEYPAGSDVMLMKGTIVSKEAVNLEDVRLALTTATNNLSTYFTTLYLKVGSSIFSYTPVAGDVQGGNIEFEWSTTINGVANVQLYGTLKTNASGTIKFGSLDLSSFFTTKEYVSNGITVGTAVGSIAGISVSVQDTPLNVTRVDGLGDTTVAAGTDNVSLYKIKLSSNQGNGVRVSNAKFTVTTSGASFSWNTTLTLKVNGTAKQSKTFDWANPVTFTNFGSTTVNSTNDATIEITADIKENVTNTHTIKVTLNDLTATDLLTSSAITNYTKPAGALFEVNTANAAISLSNDLVLSKLLLSPSTNERIAAVKIAPTNDKVRLYNVVLDVTGASVLNNFRLVNASGTTIATASSISGTEVYFTNMSSTSFVDKDKSESYYVVADINSNVSSATDVVVGLVSANGRASNGTTVGSATTGVANAHKVFDKSITVTRLDNTTTKSLTTSALRFSVKANGKDVTLANIGVALSSAGYTGTAGWDTAKIYKNSVSTANLVTSSTTVDAGATVTFIVAFPDAIVKEGSSSQDWNVSLTGMTVNNVQVSPYYNVAEFPITERK